MIDPRVDRIFQLGAWLRSVGCCGTCAFDIAVVQTAKENGEPHQLHRVCVRPSVPAGDRRKECEDAARRAWKSMPAAPAAAANPKAA